MTLNGRFASLLAVALLAGAVFAPSSARAQLQEVEQTVFGMDCAPCAHALENRLGNTEGVASVSVSLNEGQATIDLEPNNSLTLEAIREAVTQSGFSPEGATLRLTGVVKEVNGTQVLSIEAGERYALELPEGESSLQNIKGDEQVTVTGHVPADDSGNGTEWTVQVQTVDTAG